MTEQVALRHHQQIEQDHRRQGQDHRPDADSPQNILGRKARLGTRPHGSETASRIHVAPALIFSAMGRLIRERF